MIDRLGSDLGGTFWGEVDQEVGIFGMRSFERKAAKRPTEASERKIPDIGLSTAFEADGVYGGVGRQKARKVAFADVIGSPHIGDDAFLLFLFGEASL